MEDFSRDSSVSKNEKNYFRRSRALFSQLLFHPFHCSVIWFDEKNGMAERSERRRSAMQTGGDYGFGLVAPSQNATAVSLLPRSFENLR